MISCFVSTDITYCRRKGAGRKPKVLANGTHPPSTRGVERLRGNVDDLPTLCSSPSGSSETQDPPGSREAPPVIPSINGHLIDANEIHSSLRQYPDIPHHLHPITLISGSQIHASVAPTITAQRPRSSQLVWGSVPGEPSHMGCDNSSPILTYNSQIPAEFSAPFECRRPSYLLAGSSACSEIQPTALSESPTSRSIHPLDVNESLIADLDMSPEYTQSHSPLCSSETRLDSQSSDFYNSNTLVPPCDPGSSLLPPSQLPASACRAVVPRDTFVRIAPAPSSREQRTGILPDPLFPRMTSPDHCLAIISQSPTHKRRRRRCVVCLQMGREEASYECPGRGDRTRCPSRREDGVERNISVPKQNRCDQKAKYQNKASWSMSSELTSTPSPAIDHRDAATYAPYSSQSITDPVTPKAVLTTHILYPPIATQPYVSIVPYGYPIHTSQQFIIAPGENAKRRSRRCMVCVTKDKDGTHCPGRGNRVLCPNREGEVDLFEEEQGGKEA